MAELWEWEEVYIRLQTAVMDESTAEKKIRTVEDACVPSTISNSLTAPPVLKIPPPPFPTIDVIGTMEHLEERPAPICPLLFC